VGQIRIKAVDNQQKHRRGVRLSVACVVFVAVLCTAGGLVAWVAGARHGTIAAMAAGAAAFTCGVSGTVALILAGRSAGTRWAVHGIMLAGIVRFLIPLLVVAASSAVQGPLSRAGMFGYMVIFFLISLIAETLLLVGVMRSTDASRIGVAWKGN
jgi:hypothetical protein